MMRKAKEMKNLSVINSDGKFKRSYELYFPRTPNKIISSSPDSSSFSITNHNNVEVHNKNTIRELKVRRPSKPKPNPGKPGSHNQVET